jgi:uncharacterized RDD family membrane protein YckC
VVAAPIEAATHTIHTGTFVDVNGRVVHGFQWSPDGWFWLIGLLWIGYMTLMEGTRNASLGKMAMGIRVARLGGRPMDLSTAFVRNILRIVDGFLFYLVGAIFVWSSPTRQRLGDRAAHTVVIPASVSTPVPGSPAPWMPPMASAPPPPPPPLPPPPP